MEMNAHSHIRGNVHELLLMIWNDIFILRQFIHISLESRNEVNIASATRIAATNALEFDVFTSAPSDSEFGRTKM